jgi:hypothetical protein
VAALAVVGLTRATMADVLDHRKWAAKSIGGFDIHFNSQGRISIPEV